MHTQVRQFSVKDNIAIQAEIVAYHRYDMPMKRSRILQDPPDFLSSLPSYLTCPHNLQILRGLS